MQMMHVRLSCIRRWAALFLAGGLLVVSGAHATEFIALGALPGAFNSYTTGVSADGSIIVGVSSLPDPDSGTDSSMSQPVLWQFVDGRMVVDRLDDSGFITMNSKPLGISPDGAVVVGYRPNGMVTEPFRWSREEGMMFLRSIGGRTAFASAASADGAVVVGAAGTGAFRWTAQTGMVSLGNLPGAIDHPEAIIQPGAWDVTPDGRIIVGGAFGPHGQEAFRWTGETGMVGLGELAGGDYYSSATAISANGRVIVGESVSADGRQAFRWTESGGMTGLGFLPVAFRESIANDVSADGSVIVGRSGREAFIWTSASGMRSIMTLLAEEGLDLSGWQLDLASGVSDDGSVIVGTARLPDPSQEGFWIDHQGWLMRLDRAPQFLTYEDVAWSMSSVQAITESGHGVARECLETQLLAGRQYASRDGAVFDLYVSGFGGEGDGDATNGTLGLIWPVDDQFRLGGGLFASRLEEDDLPLSSRYEIDSQGVTLWAAFGKPAGGVQVHAAGLLAATDNDIRRGYRNGGQAVTAKGDADGHLSGLLLRGGWKFPLGDAASLTPFASYSLTRVEIDDYEETESGFPAKYHSRKDTAETIKGGIEGELQMTDRLGFWGQIGYGRRLDDRATGISGEIVGLMDFAVPGYRLDDDWGEMDLGVKWQVLPTMSVMATVGGTTDNEQQPDWRTSIGVTVSLL